MKTVNTTIVTEVSQVLQAKFKKFPQIISAYLYGSILSNQFSEKSDIDVLLIVQDLADSRSFFDEVKSARKSIGTYNLDVNVVFQREFVRRWHIYRPPTYFFWIKNRNRLLWGVDTIQTVRKSSVTPESIYRRAVDLAQSCRSIYLNDKGGTFWEPKYRRWLRTLVSEIYYLESELVFDLDFCIKKLSQAHPELAGIIGLMPKKISIKVLSEISESLAYYVNNKYIKEK